MERKAFAVVVWRDVAPTRGWYHESDVVAWYDRRSAAETRASKESARGTSGCVVMPSNYIK